MSNNGHVHVGESDWFSVWGRGVFVNNSGFEEVCVACCAVQFINYPARD